MTSPPDEVRAAKPRATSALDEPRGPPLKAFDFQPSEFAQYVLRPIAPRRCPHGLRGL